MANVSDPRPLGLVKPVVFREIALTGSVQISAVPTAPTISTGADAPGGTLTRPAGSLYLRTDGQLYQNTDGATAWTAKEASDADLTAIAALSGTGILAHTAANTWAERTLTGTADEIAVVDGDGVAGAPTFGLTGAASARLIAAYQMAQGPVDSAKIADGTTAGKLRTQANFSYRVNGAIFSAAAADDFWDLSAEVDNAAGTYRAYSLEVDAAGTASFVASTTDPATAALALAALALPAATKSRIGVFIAGPATDFNAVGGLDAQGDIYDGSPLSV